MTQPEYPRQVWCPIHRQFFTELAPGRFHGFPRMWGKLWEVAPGRFRDFSLQLKRKHEQIHKTKMARGIQQGGFNHLANSRGTIETRHSGESIPTDDVIQGNQKEDAQ